MKKNWKIDWIKRFFANLIIKFGLYITLREKKHFKYEKIKMEKMKILVGISWKTKFVLCFSETYQKIKLFFKNKMQTCETDKNNLETILTIIGNINKTIEKSLSFLNFCKRKHFSQFFMHFLAYKYFH